jgi:hypothetical protein
MSFAGFLPKRALSAAVVLASATGLTGCFDLAQKVAVRHDGSGTYAVEVAANGVVGQGLDKKHADVDIGDERAVTRTERHGDTTVETSEVAFRDVSDLKLNDETVNLHVKGKTADGATEVNFHRTFRVDHARHRHDDDGDRFGKSILESMFGGHTYKFAVWLPGTIEHIAPVHVAGETVHPTVWSDRTGHTIVWQMKLTDMFLAEQIDFDVDFAAKGDFRDGHSLPGKSHHLYRHRDHKDDDDDDDD